MLRFLFSPNGRISRSEIWLRFLLPYIGVSILAGIVDGFLPTIYSREFGNGPASWLVTLFYFWPNIAVSVKRYHDRGMTGWWVLFSILIMLPGFVALGIGFAHSGLSSLEALKSNADISVGALLHILGGCLWILIVAIAFFVILYILPGQKGENKYGPDPLEKHR